MKIWFQKLFWNQDCDVVNNLVVEVAIYNFDLFHCTLVGVCCRVGHPGFFQRHFWFMCIYKRISEWKCTQNAVMRKSKYIQINLIFGCWYVIVGKRVGNGAPPPLQWHFSYQFLYPIFFNWILHMKRILHFVPDKYIISKSSYNWFKIDTLQLLYDYIKQNTFWQSGNDPKWFLNQFCCWKKLLRHSSPPPPLMANVMKMFPFLTLS